MITAQSMYDAQREYGARKKGITVPLNQGGKVVHIVRGHLYLLGSCGRGVGWVQMEGTMK